MKNIFLLLAFFLCSCVNVSSNIEQITGEEFYKKHPEFKGKIFSNYCEGNDFSDFSDVDEKCIKTMAKDAYDKGYEYFAVMGRDAGTIKKVKDVNITPIHEKTNTFYSYNADISNRAYVAYFYVLLEKDNLNKVTMFNKVSDYYTPPKDSKKDQ